MNNHRFSYALGVVVVFGLLIGKFGVNAGINVTAEVNRIEENFGKLKAPPELVSAVLQQLDTQCKNSKKNRTIDQALLNKTTECLQTQFNNTELFSEIKESIPQGKLDSVFRNLCLKWPKCSECLQGIYEVIEDCWQKGDRVKKFMDGFFKFFCGDDNDGARIALFFAEGGMKCLEDHGDDVKKCMEKKDPKNSQQLDKINEVNLNDADDIKKTLESINTEHLPSEDEICSKLQEVSDCTNIELRKCQDSTPENLMTAMLRQVGKGLDCQVKVRSVSVSSSETAASASATKVSVPFLLASVFIWLTFT